MPNFAIKRVKDINGRQAFYQLVIDGQAVIDAFEEKLEGKYDAEFGSMFLQMQRISDLQKLAKSDFKIRKDLHEDAFEVKTENLRFYGMHVKKTGKVIVVCGYKNSQSNKDEKQVSSLIKQSIDNHTILDENEEQVSKK